MRITDVLNPTTQFSVLQDECSQFIEESQGNMLFRALPKSYNNFHKVKVRKKKSDGVDRIFNEAFDERHPHLRQRAIFTYDHLDDIDETSDPFFVFPIDGYKFMYSPEVTESKADHQRVLESLAKMTDGNLSVGLVADMLKFTYVHDNLAEGIIGGAEIVLYNTPYYYAVRANDECVDLLSSMDIL